jgi:hypothetical protein
MTVPKAGEQGKETFPPGRPDGLSSAAQRWVDEQVAKAPPLSAEQRGRLCSLLARPRSLQVL